MKKIHVFMLSVIASVALLTACGHQSIESAVAEASRECPMYIDEYTTVTNIQLEGHDIVYVCSVNEYLLGMEVTIFQNPEVISAMKQEIIKSIKYNSDPSVKDLVRMCKKDNYNIVYRYVGSSSYAIVEVRVLPSEM